MKMRNIIPLVTGGTLLATLFGSSTLHAATKSKPNLVLVLVDDMGWGGFCPQPCRFYREGVKSRVLQNTCQGLYCRRGF